MAEDDLVLFVGLKYSKKDVEKLNSIFRDLHKIHPTSASAALVNGSEDLLKAIEAKNKVKK